MLQGLVNQDRAAPLLWASDRADLQSDRQRSKWKEWQKVMAGEFSLQEPYMLHCGGWYAVTGDDYWWVGHERWDPCCIQMCRQLERWMVCVSPLIKCPGFSNEQQLLWRKNNSNDGEWRTTGSAESTRTTDKSLGIAAGDRLMLPSRNCQVAALVWSDAVVPLSLWFIPVVVRNFFGCLAETEIPQLLVSGKFQNYVLEMLKTALPR